MKGWKKLAALAAGNSRLILGLGVALVGPLRMIAPVETVAFQLTGTGGTGKSSIGVVASSFWGQRTSGGKPHLLGGGDAWNNTLANLERVLAARDRTFLFLDEAHLARPEDIISAIFLISEGQGRGRYNEMHRRQWFAPIFSTSNESVAKTLAKANEPLDRAAFDRLIDIPLPEGGSGAFENLHGSATVGDFARRIKAICNDNFGVVGRRYVRKILKGLAKDSDKLASWLERRRKYFVRKARQKVITDVRHGRVISHFATVYGALRLAGRYKLLDLPPAEVRDALLSCLGDHLRVTEGATERTIRHSSLSPLKDYVRKNRENFVNLEGNHLVKRHNPAACPGYVYKASGRRWFGFPAALVERVVGGRAAFAALRRELDKTGLIKKAGGGKDGDRFVTKVNVGSKRVYLCSLDSTTFD